MIRHFFTKQFMLFLVTGGLATIANFSSRILYNEWMSFSSAVILAYCTGTITSFILARTFVFKNSKHAVHHSALIFVLVNITSAIQTWGVSVWLFFYGLPWIGVTQFSAEIAHILGIIFPVFSNFLLHKHWTFREHKT